MNMRNNSWAGWPIRPMAVAGIVLLTSGIVQAGAWVPPSGSNAAFGWSSGQDLYSRFGNPTVTEQGFTFLNLVDFRAGIGSGKTDRASVYVDTRTPEPDGAPIHVVTVQEWGTWSKDISQPSDFGSSAAWVQLYRRYPSGNVYTPIMNLPAFDFRTDGTWSSSLQLVGGTPGVQGLEMDWQWFKITVENTLQVTSGAYPGSFIEKTGMKIILPEPGSALLMLLGGLVPLVLRSRRR